MEMESLTKLWTQQSLSSCCFASMSLICPIYFSCDPVLARSSLKTMLEKHGSASLGGPAGQVGWSKDTAGCDDLKVC